MSYIWNIILAYAPTSAVLVIFIDIMLAKKQSHHASSKLIESCIDQRRVVISSLERDK